MSETATRDGLRGLLRQRGYWQWSVTAQCARLPIGMAPLALTVLVAPIGGYQLAGALVATLVLTEVVAAVPAGRALDRLDRDRTLRLLLLAGGLGWLGLALLAGAAPPAGVLMATVVLVGLAVAAVPGGLRAVLPEVITPAHLPAALALDQTIVGVTFALAPLLVSALVLAGSAGGVLGMAAVCLAAALAMPQARADRQARVVARSSGRLPNDVVTWFWLAAPFALGHAVGTIDNLALPIVDGLGGGNAAAALLLALLCATSAVSGFAYALIAARLPTPTPSGAAILATAMALGSLLVFGGAAADLPSVGRWALVIAGVSLLGLCTAPLSTVNSVGLQGQLPESSRVTGFSAAFTAQGLGFALSPALLSVLPTATVVGLSAISPVVVAAAGVLLSRVTFVGLRRSWPKAR